jgi:aspartate carbamoyltransferase catalytic subunit
VTRHLLDIESLDRGDAEWLIARACELADGATCKPRDGIVANLFFEASTRTRASFQIAARRLGLEVVNIDHSVSSTTKGESLADTAATLAAMGVDAIVLRHPDDDSAADLADRMADQRVAIVNAGSGQRAHPSQALLDAATLSAAGFDWPNTAIAIVGDLRHSRVARSDVALFECLGVGEIRLAAPDAFMPDPGDMAGSTRFDDLDEALAGADAVICLRIQRERIAEQGYPDGETFHRQWGMTPERLARMPDHARILHPGPVNRGVELAGSLVEHPRSLIIDQVRIGVHLRTALFEWLIEPATAPY